MDKPHVVFFPAWYPHRLDPMPGIFVKHHAESLLPYAQVSVLQVQGEERRDGALIEFVFDEEDGISTQRVYYRKQKGLFGKAIDAYNYFYGSLKGYSMLIARKGKADLHHIHVLTRAGFLPWLIRISGGVPYLITEHWCRYLPGNREKFGGKLKKWLTAQIVKRAFAVCPVNENLGISMQEMGFSNSRYQPINNVVDIHRFVLPEKRGPSTRFVHVSCFIDIAKNTKGLLRAFKAALGIHPSLFLTLVGDGPDWESNKLYASELGLDAYIDFKGILVGTQLVEAYQSHGSLVMFSNYENQPVVILEAFSCGIPVISTGVGGIPELLEEGRGVLIDVGDEEALTKAILAQATADNGLSAESLHAYIENHYSYDAIGKMYSSLYQQALK